MAVLPTIALSHRLRGDVTPDMVRQLARRMARAAARMGVQDDELANIGVRLVDAPEMARLHWIYMRERGATDVLSFPGTQASEDADETALLCGHGWQAPGASEPWHGEWWSDDAGADSLGDMALCWPVIVAQAQSRAPGPVLAAATVLLVHGMAHLLGHDHRTRRQARAMHRTECIGLRAVGVPDVVRPYVRSFKPTQDR